MTATESARPMTELELVQARLGLLVELEARLAAAHDADALVEQTADVLTLLLDAIRQRDEAPGDRDAPAASERAVRNGRVSVRRTMHDGVEYNRLVLALREPGTRLDELVFRRTSPFSEHDQTLAAMAGALLDAALRHEATRAELCDSRTQLQQSERIKSIGQLASGVAHDFNNLLMVISAAAEVMSDALPPEHPHYNQLSLILETSHRAAELTRKLLTFSRKARPATKAVDVHDVLGTVREFLAHGIDRRITLQLSPCDGPCMVEADATQLGNAILNICLNARDAMPEGGLLKITSDRVELDAASCASHYAGCQPGPFVRLQIQDDGTGMDADTLARAFEPFFTTKEPGRGTGLGLPVVLAAAREHKGTVVLESEPGSGTTCSLLLPLLDGVAKDAASGPPESRRSLALRVLLVDDEPGVCLTAAQLMRQLGHNVQALCSGEKALSHLRVHSSGYDLLVLDMMMPHPTGLEVHRALVDEGIDLPTLFVSGSTDQQRHGTVAPRPGVVFLQKPFRQAELALAIAHCTEAWQSARAVEAEAELRVG